MTDIRNTALAWACSGPIVSVIVVGRFRGIEEDAFVIEVIGWDRPFFKRAVFPVVRRECDGESADRGLTEVLKVRHYLFVTSARIS